MQALQAWSKASPVMNPNTVNEESAVAGSVSNQVVPANRLSPRSADVVAMHGETKALEAFMENEDGNGPKTIGYSLGVSTTVASHLIDAGRELHALNQRRDAAEESKQVVPANRYKGAVAVDSSDVTTFRSLRPGQWVRIDGHTKVERFAGVTKHGTIVIERTSKPGIGLVCPLPA